MIHRVLCPAEDPRLTRQLARPKEFESRYRICTYTALDYDRINYTLDSTRALKAEIECLERHVGKAVHIKA